MLSFFSKTAFLGLMLGVCFPFANSWARALQPAEILTKVDYILTPKGSYDYEGKVSVQQGQAHIEEKSFKGFVQDPLHRRIVLEKPAKEAGESLLLDGDNFWLYLPKVKKSLRVPPQSDFAGEISNADLGQPFLSMGYQAVLAETKVLDGTSIYVLRLIPRSSNSLYAKLKLWVTKEDFRPIKLEYFGPQNLLLKTCLFEDFKDELGMERPMRWVYRDAAHPEEQTVLAMNNMIRKNFDPKAFEPGALPPLFSSPQARPKSTSAPIQPRRRSGSALP